MTARVPLWALLVGCVGGAGCAASAEGAASNGSKGELVILKDEAGARTCRTPRRDVRGVSLTPQVVYHRQRLPAEVSDACRDAAQPAADADALHCVPGAAANGLPVGGRGGRPAAQAMPSCVRFPKPGE